MVDRMCVKPPTVSKMLDRLERTGLVERRPDSEDSRISRVYLTEQGHRSQSAVRDIWTDLEQRIVAGLDVEGRSVVGRFLLPGGGKLSRNTKQIEHHEEGDNHTKITPLFSPPLKRPKRRGTTKTG